MFTVRTGICCGFFNLLRYILKYIGLILHAAVYNLYSRTAYVKIQLLWVKFFQEFKKK